MLKEQAVGHSNQATEGHVQENSVTIEELEWTGRAWI